MIIIILIILIIIIIIICPGKKPGLMGARLFSGLSHLKVLRCIILYHNT